MNEISERRQNRILMADNGIRREVRRELCHVINYTRRIQNGICTAWKLCSAPPFTVAKSSHEDLGASRTRALYRRTMSMPG